MASRRTSVVGDAIPQPLTASPGDAARGRAIVANRQVGCACCATPGRFRERFQGNLAPDLGGAGARWSAGQLRLRLVDGRRLNPATIMPSYHRTEGLVRVGPAWQGKPVLSAQQIEDVVAFLATLRDHEAKAPPRTTRRDAARRSPPAWLIAQRGVGARRPTARSRPRSATFSSGERVATGKVQFDIAPLVENGNTVPITVSVDSPMTPADHVKAIAVFNERNPQRDVVGLHARAAGRPRQGSRPASASRPRRSWSRSRA